MSTKWYSVLEDFNENFHVDQLHSMILLLEQRAENSTFSNHRSEKVVVLATTSVQAV